MRAFFADSGYSEAALKKTVGRSAPPARGELQLMLFMTRDASPGNVLARLFLMGADVARESADELLPEWFRDLCIDCGMLSVFADRYRAEVVIVPTDEFLVVSDAFAMLGTDASADFVLPASTHSANFLRRLIVPGRAGDALDLGCGCGIHALYLSLQSARVVASDISERAAGYARFNAELNARANIEVVTGDRLQAVGERRFDLIVSNPPFVPGPESLYTYRDTEGELDEFCAALVQDAAAHLEVGGILQMLCEWVEIEGQDWQDRVRSWVSDTACDTWILHSPPQRPGAYVRQRAGDIQSAVGSDAQAFDDWVMHFRERNVTAIHPGMILLRKRDGKNWFHVHDMASDLTGSAGEAVLRGIGACDFLESCSDDGELGEARLKLSPYLKLEQRYGREDAHWQPETAVLTMSDGMTMEAEIDMPVMAFLNQLDGSRSVNACVERFAEVANAPADKISADFMPIIRLFIGRGFIVPAAKD